MRTGQLVVAERLTQQAMGERIGASREMISHFLGDLKAGGDLVEAGGRLIIRRRPPPRW